MIKVIVIGIYSNKVIEEKNVKTYSIAEDYVYGKHNSVYDIKYGENAVTYYIYR